MLKDDNWMGKVSVSCPEGIEFFKPIDEMLVEVLTLQMREPVVGRSPGYLQVIVGMYAQNQEEALNHSRHIVGEAIGRLGLYGASLQIEDVEAIQISEFEAQIKNSDPLFARLLYELEGNSYLNPLKSED